MSDFVKRGSRRNFFIVDNGIFDESLQIEALDKLVYICLLRYADNNSRECFPGMQKIADDIGISKRRVITAIERLSEKSLIEKTTRYDNKGSQKSNLYIVFDANEVIHNLSNKQPEGVNVVHGGGERGALWGVNDVHTKKTHLKILKEKEKPFPQVKDEKENTVQKVDFSKLKSLIT